MDLRPGVCTQRFLLAVSLSLLMNRFEIISVPTILSLPTRGGSVSSRPCEVVEAINNLAIRLTAPSLKSV